MAQGGRDSKRSTLSGAHDFVDSLGPTMAGGSDSFRSTLAGGNDFVDSLGPTLAGGSDSFRSTLAGGNDFIGSLRTALPLEGGSDFVSFDYACGQCDDQKPAVGFCKECDSYLCSECYETHLKPKPTRHHTLLDAGSMPRRPSCDPCSSDGKDLDAVGFCQDCAEYLCASCFRTHLRTKPCRNHVLLDQSRMPKFKHHPRGPPVISETTRNDESNQPREARRTRAEHARDINVHTKDDETPAITGMVVVVPGQSLVVVDGNNSSVKLVDLKRGSVQALVQLPRLLFHLFDIARVSDSRVVVTSFNEQTPYFIKVRDRMLNTDTQIKVKGMCTGIASCNDTLLVTYKAPAKVEILSKSGTVLQTIVTPDTGERLFTAPYYVEVSRDQTTLYISDAMRHTVTRLTLAGEVLATYQDDELLLSPRGLAVDKAGDVYVCGRGSDNVVQLTSDLTQPRQLLQASDGLKEHESVCYCQATNTLYVGMVANVVKVFLLKS